MASISKLTDKKKGFVVKWSKVKEAAGYDVRYALKSSMKGSNTISSKGKATSKKVSKLKSKKKYYVQVCPYKMVDGVKYIGPWSAKKAVRTK